MIHTNDLGYLRSILPLTMDELSFRRQQLLELKQQFMKDFSSCLSDGTMMLIKRVEIIEIAMALKVSEPVATSLPTLRRPITITGGWAQHAEHFDAAQAFAAPSVQQIPVLLKGGDQHNVEYPAVVAKETAVA